MATVSPQDPSSAPFDFDQEVCALVLDPAPRMFATGRDADDVAGLTGARRVALRRRKGLSARLVWLDPGAGAAFARAEAA